jgi:peptide/nickel transport system permease protein
MLVLLARGVSRIVLIALVAGLAGAMFVRLGPGFGASVQELDPRLSDATRAAIERQNSVGRDVPRYYVHWIASLLHGDLGISPSLHRPISELLRERAGITAAEVAEGAASGVALGFLLAVVLLGCPRPIASLLGGLSSSVALSVPAAVVALLCLWLEVSPTYAIAAAVFPHSFQYLTAVLRTSAASDHVLAARARGVGSFRILFLHVVAPVLGEVAAVSGMAVSIAFGASIPIEAVCSRPGVGELVWHAAMSRDLPILVSMTVLIAIVTIGANTLTDIVVVARNPVRGSAQ